MMRFLVVFTLLLLLCGCQVTDEGVLFHTADPNLMIGFRFAPTPPPAEPEVLPGDEVGEVVPDPLPHPPCDFMDGDTCQPIKGNISRSGEKIYHVPGGANYNQVKIDESAGEMFFRTEAEAQAAGWRKAGR